MKLFTGLKKIREYERQQLPFLKSVVDFDIVIEIGYAEEQGQPLTLKQLFLLNVRRARRCAANWPSLSSKESSSDANMRTISAQLS